MLGLLGMQFFLKSPQPPPENKPATSTTAPATLPAAPATRTPAAPPTKTSAQAIATKQATGESETVIENGLYKITFTNRGAQVKSWILKKYTDDKGQPLELVHP